MSRRLPSLPLALFAFATLAPVPLIALSAVCGGIWCAAALVCMAFFPVVLDEAVAWVTPATGGDDFPAATALSVTLVLAHFGLLALVVAALAGTGLSPAERIATFSVAAIYFGQVSNANAHELIHRPGRGLRRLGTWVFISHLFGHHASAHPLVHHVHVATRADPATARRGESFYRFAIRSWRDGYREGHDAETGRLLRAHLPLSRHPYRRYRIGAEGFCGASLVTYGLPGLGWYVGLAVAAQLQLLMSDYVQHYGLVRDTGPDGRPSPVGPHHSWNSRHPLSSAMMLNAPRHSDHHSRPMRPFPALTLPAGAPMLPRSLPVMSVLALSPRLWRRVMDKRVREVRVAAAQGAARRQDRPIAAE